MNGGNVINLISTAGLYGWQSQLAYNTSKDAAKQITETVATEHSPDGIRANAICPGFAPTALPELTPGPDKFAVYVPALLEAKCVADERVPHERQSVVGHAKGVKLPLICRR
ncbi:gluconate 5-dehydrogenase [Halalkalicoccus paucihalophilus]|uniref:Gluconate 5-dehydrogenase n=1 Tax=Halalkalicoccus paucihalophilus TaxID=1008153 RepID=A0A151A8T5_9EURY|nr:gluconate 5-dehydrogenase [Halalkalicoccus paucihalophilus]